MQLVDCPALFTRGHLLRHCTVVLFEAAPGDKGEVSREYTNNPLYTHTRYNDKVRYNDNCCCTENLMRRLICKKCLVLFLFSHKTYVLDTDKTLYTDTRYNDKIRYNHFDNLTVTKPSPKRL